MKEYALILMVLIAIAVGTIWTAYESHIANLGVAHWASEFSQIREGVAPEEPQPTETATPGPPMHNL